MPNQHPQITTGSADKKSIAELQALLNEKNGAGLVVDGIFGPKTSQAVRNYQQQNDLQVDGIVGPKTWASLLASDSTTPDPVGEQQTGNTGTDFAGTPRKDRTNALQDAMEAAKEAYEEKVEREEFSFDGQAQLDQAAQDYLQRAAFSYDLSGDPLYQQYASQYIQAGRQAMEDTMGQAAALTGGYGNSYAQTAGQQVYGGYLQQLNDRIPELYELALSKYEKEGEQLRKRYELLRGLESQAYARYQDTLKRDDALRKETYEKDRESKADKQAKRNELIKLVQLGYMPTAKELLEAGLTQAQISALLPKAEQ